MTAFISPPPRLQFFTNAGVPMAGGFLYTYAAGTTTPLVTYTDSSGTIANTNPIILDSRGEASIWLGGVGYKFKLATPANVDVWTQDNIAPGSSANMTYTPAGTGAVTTTVQAKLRESVSVKDFGATGNGSTDDTAAFTAALATGANEILVPAGNYRTTATIVMSLSGQRLSGASRNGSSILADFRGGPVIEVANSRCQIFNLAVSSLGGSARRNASPLGVTPPSALVDGNSLDRGIYLNETTVGTVYTRIEQCDVVYQPGDGINIGGTGSATVITQVGISYCGGHGIYADDGDRDGAPKTRSGIVTIDNCVIQQCWGHGVALAINSATTVFRYALNELDIFSVCLGDGGVNQPAFYSSVKAAIAMKCENTTVTQCGVSAETGIIIGTANDVDLSSNRYVSCVNYGVIVNPNCSRVVITNPYFFGAPLMGFRVQTGCDNVRVDGIKTSELSSATTIIDAESEVNCLIDNKLVLTVPGSNILFYSQGVASSTVTGGICSIQAGRVEMVGEGNVADNVDVFRFTTSIEVPDGYVFTVFNFNAYNLTLRDRTVIGSGNIELQGVNAVLEPNESLVFLARSGVYYAIGREVP